MRLTPRSAAILGALTADAAALGLHWLYDADQLRKLQQDAPLAFRTPDAQNYAGVKGYFAHAGKHAGDRSCYGEPCRLMLAHLARNAGRFERRRFQQEWLASFGPGGSWVGYIDRPTRAAVLRLLACPSPDEYPECSGSDDDQLPALVGIPAILAGHTGTLDGAIDAVLSAVAVTHDNALARSGAVACATALHAVLSGLALPEALFLGAGAAGDVLGPLLQEALAMPALDPAAAAARFGMPCHLPQGLPVLFHIARTAENFRIAVEANILAGGDSCGRSLMLGALTATHDAHRQANGCDAALGIPLEWLARLHDLAGVTNDVQLSLARQADHTAQAQ